jgi:hypothetical protein
VIGRLTDDELEKIVMEEFARAARNGFGVTHEGEVTLARMVAVRMRKIAQDSGVIRCKCPRCAAAV